MNTTTPTRPVSLEELVEQFGCEAYAEAIHAASKVFCAAGDPAVLAVDYALMLFNELQGDRHKNGFRIYTPAEWENERAALIGAAYHMVAVSA